MCVSQNCELGYFKNFEKNNIYIKFGFEPKNIFPDLFKVYIGLLENSTSRDVVLIKENIRHSTNDCSYFC